MATEFTITIKGANWLIKKLTPRKFKKVHHESWAAVTLPETKEIHINGDTYLPKDIRHELVHAFVEETNTNDVDMSAYDMEELCCNLFAEFGIDIIKLTDQIITKFKTDS